MSIADKIARAKADLDEVFEAGKQAEWNAYWDAYQDYGKRTGYNKAFAEKGWNDVTFKPKYDIRPSWAIVETFNNCGITDLEAILQECGIVLDTSNNYNYSQSFASAKFTVLPEIVFSDFAGITYETFGNCTELHTIRKINLKTGFDCAMNDTFKGCTALENVVFDGVIPKNINMQWSTKLSKASITSIINALSTTTSGLTVTLSATAVNNAFATSTGAGNGSTSAEWLALVATRYNWTISLA